MKIFDYIDFFEASGKVVWWLVIGYLAIQVITEILKFRGIIVPEIMNFRSYIERRKKEKETIQKMADLLPVFESVPDVLKKNTELMANVDKHYSTDNIKMRDDWIKGVNAKLEANDSTLKMLADTQKENCENVLDLLIESKRSAIIGFASKVIDPNAPVTHAEFERIFRIDKEYNEIIEKHELENGEVDIAMGLIREAYKNHMMNHSFLEDVRGLKKSK